MMLKKVLDLGQRKRLEMYQNAIGNLEYSEPSDPRVPLLYLMTYLKIYGGVFATGARILPGMDREMLDNLFNEIFEILMDLRFVVLTFRRLRAYPYDWTNYFSLRVVETLMKKYGIPEDLGIGGLQYELERRAFQLLPIIDNLLADVMASYGEAISGEGKFISFRSIGPLSPP